MVTAETLVTLEHSLRKTLDKEAAESERRQKAAEIQKLVWEQRRTTLALPTHLNNGTATGEHTNQTSDSTVQIGWLIFKNVNSEDASKALRWDEGAGAVLMRNGTVKSCLSGTESL